MKKDICLRCNLLSTIIDRSEGEILCSLYDYTLADPRINK